MKKIILTALITIVIAGVSIYCWKDGAHDKIDFTQFAGVDYVTANGGKAHYENTVLKVGFDFPAIWTYNNADSKSLSSRFESGRLFDAFAKDNKNSVSLTVSEHSSFPLVNGNTGESKENLPEVSFAGAKIIPVYTSSNFNGKPVQYISYTLTKNGYDYTLNVYGDVKLPLSAEVMSIIDSLVVGDLNL